MYVTQEIHKCTKTTGPLKDRVEIATQGYKYTRGKQICQSDANEATEQSPLGNSFPCPLLTTEEKCHLVVVDLEGVCDHSLDQVLTNSEICLARCGPPGKSRVSQVNTEGIVALAVNLIPHSHQLNMFNYTRFRKMKTIKEKLQIRLLCRIQMNLNIFLICAEFEVKKHQ